MTGIFQPGARYVVLQDFARGGELHRGDVLLFESDGYSRYDSCFVYEFRRESDGKRQEWVLYDGEDPETWSLYLRRLA